MNRLIKKWLTAQEAEEQARLNTLDAYEDAKSAAIPGNLRPATAKDIVEGGIIWYPEHKQEDDGEWDAIAGWKYVGEVLRPSCDYKAFCSEDGCRYGLQGAFVEKS